MAAQTDLATVTGTVLDQSQSVIPAAKVTVRAIAIGSEHTTFTNTAGAYTLSALPVGQYTASLTAPDFTTVNIEPFNLEVGQTRTLNATLLVGTVESKVSVDAGAADLNQASAEIGAVIRPGQIRDIPLNGRNWAALMSLIPGAIDSSTGVESGVRFCRPFAGGQ
jgi:hypothetical protein